jgi:spore coat polysaccharide biosynthesis protein SpsF
VNNSGIGIIIQARMGSTRLPGKILMPIGGKVLLKHILFRLGTLRHPVTIVIATTDTRKDDIVKSFCDDHAVACFRGSENNVLDRFYQCAVQFGFRHIVRLTGDNPFPDMEELDSLITLHLSERTDYANSFASLPIGAGAEIFTFEALKKSWQEGTEPHQFEHVNEYMLEHPELFSTVTLTVATNKKRPEVRLTVDTEDDYKRACFIVGRSCSEYISIPQAISLADEFETSPVLS